MCICIWFQPLLSRCLVARMLFGCSMCSSPNRSVLLRVLMVNQRVFTKHTQSVKRPARSPGRESHNHDFKNTHHKITHNEAHRKLTQRYVVVSCAKPIWGSIRCWIDDPIQGISTTNQYNELICYAICYALCYATCCAICYARCHAVC